jgi:hypothetical protein
MEEEDGVVGGVLERGHRVVMATAHQVVNVVVGHLELHLSFTTGKNR